MFQNYVVHFVNKAATSKIVGMDAVYVHMVDNYYANDLAYWADPESVKKMVGQVEKLRPLLIGKDAPNIKMKRRDGTPVELYDVEANYTILYFWQFECGSCKKATPVMKEFYAKWKNKGVEIFSICTKQGEIDKCWEYIDEKEIGEWLHATDRYMRFYKDYDIRSTPTIFVLDENKQIVSKQIGASQLDELLTALERQKEAEKGK
jgi:thiol-disulfide isomerase/thioredoxin